MSKDYSTLPQRDQYVRATGVRELRRRCESCGKVYASSNHVHPEVCPRCGSNKTVVTSTL